MRRSTPFWWREQTLTAKAVRGFLRPFAWLYAAAVAARNFAFDHGHKIIYSAERPVISIGNLVAGGSGKTPIVLALVQRMQACGARPAILTRGYGVCVESGRGAVVMNRRVTIGTLPKIPDESMMISAEVPEIPISIDPSRVDGAIRVLTAMSRYDTTHFILDDGFQHRSIKRDVDIVLVNHATFVTNALLPAGPLREAYAALHRATIVAAVGWSEEEAEEVAKAARENTDVDVVTVVFGNGKPILVPDAKTGGTWDQVKDRVCLVAGVADFRQVKRSADMVGAKVVSSLDCGDHGSISGNDLAANATTAAAILTTSKDYWRSPQVFAAQAIPVFILPVTVSAEALWQRLGFGKT